LAFLKANLLTRASKVPLCNRSFSSPAGISGYTATIIGILRNNNKQLNRFFLIPAPERIFFAGEEITISLLNIRTVRLERFGVFDSKLRSNPPAPLPVSAMLKETWSERSSHGKVAASIIGGLIVAG
jgi:hypothetical protein